MQKRLQAGAAMTAGVSIDLERSDQAGRGDRRSVTVQIPKNKIIASLRQSGENEKAAQAGQELPAAVDTDQHRDLLDRLGIDPSAVLRPKG